MERTGCRCSRQQEVVVSRAKQHITGNEGLNLHMKIKHWNHVVAVKYIYLFLTLSKTVIQPRDMSINKDIGPVLILLILLCMY